MICDRCRKKMKRGERRSVRAASGFDPAKFVPSPEDSWARVELWRWKYGKLPEHGDDGELDIPGGLDAMAVAIKTKPQAEWPDPSNIASVLVYVAKVLRSRPGAV